MGNLVWPLFAPVCCWLIIDVPSSDEIRAADTVLSVTPIVRAHVWDLCRKLFSVRCTLAAGLIQQQLTTVLAPLTLSTCD